MAQQGISLNCSCSLEGFGYQFVGIEQFCWGVLHFSLGMASLVLTGSIVPSLLPQALVVLPSSKQQL